MKMAERQNIFCASTWFLLTQTFLIVEATDGGNLLLNQSDCTVQKTSYCRAIKPPSHSVYKCKITDVCELAELMEDKKNTTQLLLTRNNLQVLPDSFLSKYQNLTVLSIAYNNIIHLKYEAFKGLDNLKILSLTHNPLRSFSGNLSGLLPSLSVLWVTGIEYWVLDKEFLQLPKLKHIASLRLFTKISHRLPHKCCTLTRKNITWLVPALSVQGYGACVVETLRLNKRSLLAQTLNSTLFHVQCNKCNKRLSKNKIEYYFQNVENTCWKTTVIAISCQSAVGGLAALLNLVVLLNITTSRSLRKNVSMLFVCNMALSDMFLGIYSLHIGIYLNSHPFLTLETQAFKCREIGFSWMLGQAGVVITSFLLTLERYFVIVYSLNPSIRISRRMALILISVCWFIALFLTGFALYMKYFGITFFCIPIRLSIDLFVPYVFTLTIGSVALFLYLISFYLYIRVFIAAKRAANNAGVKRESRLAKRISILVGSNVLCFVIPVFFMSIIVFSGNERALLDVAGDLFNAIPSVFLSINSCLNPIIHAFRTDNFKNVLKQRVAVVRSKLASILTSFGVLSLRAKPTSVKTVQPGNGGQDGHVIKIKTTAERPAVNQIGLKDLGLQIPTVRSLEADANTP